VTRRAGGLLLVLTLTLAVAGCGDEDRADQEAFCAELRQSIDQNVTVFDPQDPADPTEAIATLDELVALAPAEIEAEVVVLRDAFTGLADAIADVDPEDPSGADRLAEVDLDEERITRAQEAMAAYGRDPCRVPLLEGPGSATTTTPTTTTVPESTTTSVLTEPTAPAEPTG
jgi:hypothetical protein